MVPDRSAPKNYRRMPRPGLKMYYNIFVLPEHIDGNTRKQYKDNENVKHRSLFKKLVQQARQK